MLGAYVGGAFLEMSQPFLLQSLGAVVLGGALIFGGSPPAVGTLFGSVLPILIVTTMRSQSCRRKPRIWFSESSLSLSSLSPGALRYVAGSSLHTPRWRPQTPRDRLAPSRGAPRVFTSRCDLFEDGRAAKRIPRPAAPARVPVAGASLECANAVQPVAQITVNDDNGNTPEIDDGDGLQKEKRRTQPHRFYAPSAALAFALSLIAFAPAFAQVSAVSVLGPFGLSVAPNGKIWTGLYATGSFAVLSADGARVTATFPTAANATEAAFFGNLAIFSSEYTHAVYAIDRTTRATQWTLNIPSTAIANVAVSPAGIGYATSDPHTLTAFNPATGLALAAVTTGSQPRGIAFSTNGSILAVANKSSATLDLINTANMTIAKVAPVGRSPTDILIDGMFAYTSNYKDATVSKVNIKTGVVVATVTVGPGPRRLATTGNRLFVANEGGNSVTVLNVSTMATIRVIPIGGSPRGIAVNATGARLFVANTSGNAIYTYNIARRGMRPPAPAAPAARFQAVPYQSNRVKGVLVDVAFILCEWSF